MEKFYMFNIYTKCAGNRDRALARVGSIMHKAKFTPCFLDIPGKRISTPR